MLMVATSSLVIATSLFLLQLHAASSFTVRPHRSLRLHKHRTQLAMGEDDARLVEKSRFVSPSLASQVKSSYGTPTYIYDETTLVAQGKSALAFPNLYGLKVRFAMKACPNAAILQIFNEMGICFDASSGYEAQRAIRAGVNPTDISLSSQEMPPDEMFTELFSKGMEFNACSLSQLKTFGKLFPGGSCGVRFNPGKGSGGTGKTNVGGPAASFGIWHDLVDEVKSIAEEFNIKIVRVHTHIGSGSDPEIWQNVAGLSLGLVEKFPDVVTLNLGGGYKVGRMSYEKSTDLAVVGEPVTGAFKAFAERTGRELKLEIEPGTFLVANAGVLLSTVQDIVTTATQGEDAGYTFIKLDTGMTEVLRPSLYGAQHPLVVQTAAAMDSAAEATTEKYIVVGHCCESGDLFTCAPGDPEALLERTLASAKIGDLLTIEGAGAYCSAMSTKNYNSFPEAPEVLIDTAGNLHLIRKRQTLDQMLINEVPYKK